MLYIIENRKTLAIAWNGYAPKPTTFARWEVLNQNHRTALKKA